MQCDQKNSTSSRVVTFVGNKPHAMHIRSFLFGHSMRWYGRIFPVAKMLSRKATPGSCRSTAQSLKPRIIGEARDDNNYRLPMTDDCTRHRRSIHRFVASCWLLRPIQRHTFDNTCTTHLIPRLLSITILPVIVHHSRWQVMDKQSSIGRNNLPNSTSAVASCRSQNSIHRAIYVDLFRQQDSCTFSWIRNLDA